MPTAPKLYNKHPGNRPLAKGVLLGRPRYLWVVPRQAHGGNPFPGGLGGLHLLYASPERIQATIATLDRYQVQTVAANHCTGRRALITMGTALGGRCWAIAAVMGEWESAGSLVTLFR